MNNSKGFTLLEVLVALVLLAVALSAIIKTSSENTLNTATLRNKYLASIVAGNKLAELQVAKTWPGIGFSNGNAELAQQKWEWNLKVEGTPDDRLRKLILTVALEQDKEHTLYRLISYLGKP